jgi:hypothetical protein
MCSVATTRTDRPKFDFGEARRNFSLDIDGEMKEYVSAPTERSSRSSLQRFTRARTFRARWPLSERARCIRSRMTRSRLSVSWMVLLYVRPLPDVQQVRPADSSSANYAAKRSRRHWSRRAGASAWSVRTVVTVDRSARARSATSRCRSGTARRDRRWHSSFWVSDEVSPDDDLSGHEWLK